MTEKKPYHALLQKLFTQYFQTRYSVATFRLEHSNAIYYRVNDETQYASTLIVLYHCCKYNT